MTVNRRIAHHLWAIFGPLKYRILLVLVLMCINQIVSAVNPYIQGMIVDNLNRKAALGSTLWLIGLVGLIKAVTHWGLVYPRERFEVNEVDFDIEERMADETMKHVTSLSIGQHNRLHSQTKQNIINRGQAAITNLVLMTVYQIAPTILRVGVLVVALCWMNVYFGLVIFIASGLYVGQTIYVNYKHSEPFKKLERMWNKESKFRGEILQHISHVLVNAQEKRAIEESDAVYNEAVGVAKPVIQKFLIEAYIPKMFVILGNAVMTALGAYYVYIGQYTIGSVVVLWYWSNDVFSSLENIGSMQRQIMRSVASIRRFCEFLDLESDVVENEQSVSIEHLQGRIEFRSVAFTYPQRHQFTPDSDHEPDEDGEGQPGHPALVDVSFEVAPGETVAIVGESGSGKSTLIGMLLRASDPTSGEVRIDGHDLRTIDVKGLRKQIGIVEQTVPLFDRSVRENILYGLNGHRQDITEEQLEKVAQVSQISRFFHKLERGFETVIGERGITLSGGERQRVGIARALIKNPAILVFDEATSSLDAGVEAEIREAIREASIGRTTIIVAHRFSTIRYANRIIVMDQGRVVGEGKHEDLYASCEPYRKLVDHQVISRN